MKLFDYLQDVVAIAAVLTLVVFMTSDTDALDSSGSTALTVADSVEASPDAASSAPFPTLAEETINRLASESTGQAALQAEAALDRLEADLKSRLGQATPVLEASDQTGRAATSQTVTSRTGQAAALPVVEVPSSVTPGPVPREFNTPARVPAMQIDESAVAGSFYDTREAISRAVPPLPDASDYNLSAADPLLPKTMPWQKPAATDAEDAIINNPARRRGGAAPVSSRPLSPRATETLPPPPQDETEFDLQPFGASIRVLRPSELATAPPAPIRMR